MRERILQADKDHVWHPYTPMDEYIAQAHPLVIDRAQGARIFDVNGRSLLDGNASWWVAALGHNHPRLIDALRRQSERLCHVSLAGVTHEAAALLAEELANRCPGDLRRVFFTDDGSTAVEAAVKMCAQYWYQQNLPRKRRFLTLEGAFHGETVGASSLGDVEVFRRPFAGILFDCIRVPAPSDEVAYQHAFDALENALHHSSQELAALVLEPLVQGANGMRFYAPSFLQRARALCDQYNVLLIADEVFTGYGRTGRFWACEQAEIIPDLICTAKGFSGGMLPMGAVIASERIFQGFFGGRDRAFLYGHSFCGNPLGAAVAREVLRIFEEEQILEGIPERAHLIHEAIHSLDGTPGVTRCRSLGMIGALDLSPTQSALTTSVPSSLHDELDAVELRPEGGYLALAGWRVYEEALQRGAYLRPLGNVVYVAPPLNIPTKDLQLLLQILCDSVKESIR